MIDRELRKRLDRELLQMLRGELSRSDFDEACWFRYAATGDRGVREIAEFCRSLYADSSSVCAVREIHPLLVRAILFLRSECDYRWRRPVASVDPGLWWGIGLMMLLPVLMGVFFFSVPVGYSLSSGFGWGLTGLGVIGLGIAIWLVGRGGWLRGRGRQQRAGDVESPAALSEFWPFSGPAEWQSASNRCLISARLFDHARSDS